MSRVERVQRAPRELLAGRTMSAPSCEGCPSKRASAQATCTSAIGGEVVEAAGARPAALPQGDEEVVGCGVGERIGPQRLSCTTRSSRAPRKHLAPHLLLYARLDAAARHAPRMMLAGTPKEASSHTPRVCADE